MKRDVSDLTCKSILLHAAGAGRPVFCLLSLALLLLCVALPVGPE